MFFEGLDNEHDCTTIPAGVDGCRWIILSKVCCRRDAVVAEELPQSLHVFDPRVVGEETVVADAVEATGQDMQEKAPDELVDGQGQGLIAITRLGTIVLPLEGDTAFIASEQSAVADGDPMGVARQVREHGLR